jgi:hypothetical protein
MEFATDYIVERACCGPGIKNQMNIGILNRRIRRASQTPEQRLQNIEKSVGRTLTAAEGTKALNRFMNRQQRINSRLK